MYVDYAFGALAKCPTLKEIIFAEGIQKIPQYIGSGCNGAIERIIREFDTSFQTA